MSSFFTLPKSAKKRRPNDDNSRSLPKRTKTGSLPRKANNNDAEDRQGRGSKLNGKAMQADDDVDESISGSDSEDADGRQRIKDGLSGSSSEDDEEAETAAEKRLRLAENYLENIRGEVQDTVGFDAEDVDRDLIAERLEEDLSESKGRMYKHIARSYDYTRATRTAFRMSTGPITGITACDPFVYTVSKDRTVTKWQLPDVEERLNSFSHGKNKKNVKLDRRRPDRVMCVASKPAKKAPLSEVSSQAQGINRGPRQHVTSILCAAVSDSGKYLATGSMYNDTGKSSSQRRRIGHLIIYNTETMKPLKVFSGKGHHRDAITALSFRQDSHQLFTASRDRTVKVWAVDGDSASYVETLYGHQDEITGLAGYPGNIERCVSVGSRDRTARVWKVVEETQLVFRGGGIHVGPKTASAVGNPKHKIDEKGVATEPNAAFAEGSMDCLTLLDIDTFVTGSDNGSLSLWTLQKKKRVAVIPLAHGLSHQLSASQVSADATASSQNSTAVMALPSDALAYQPALPQAQPCWITAIASVPLSDLVVSGSWNGIINIWRVGPRQEATEPGKSAASAAKSTLAPKQPHTAAHLTISHVATLGSSVFSTSTSTPTESDRSVQEPIKGVINSLVVFERTIPSGNTSATTSISKSTSPKSKSKSKRTPQGKKVLCIIAGVGTEHRLGRWQGSRISSRGGNSAATEAMETQAHTSEDGTNGSFAARDDLDDEAPLLVTAHDLDGGAPTTGSEKGRAHGFAHRYRAPPGETQGKNGCIMWEIPLGRIALG